MDNKLFYVHCTAALNIDFKKASDTVDWMKLGGGGGGGGLSYWYKK